MQVWATGSGRTMTWVLSAGPHAKIRRRDTRADTVPDAMDSEIELCYGYPEA
jgi:hypothetical protein